MQGWQIVQQLEQKQLDSWERINEACAVKSPNDDASWDASDNQKVAEFVSACPLLGRQYFCTLSSKAQPLPCCVLLVSFLHRKVNGL